MTHFERPTSARLMMVNPRPVVNAARKLKAELRALSPFPLPEVEERFCKVVETYESKLRHGGKKKQ